MDTIGVNERSNINKLPLDRRKSTSTTGEGDQGDTCRICRGEGTIDQPLFYPCKCSGSIKFVHQDCLMEWLSHSKKKYCELCKTPFRFTKLYDKSMPTSLPTPLFLKQVGVHVFKTLARWLRYILVTFIWTCVLPWSIRQIWRGLFWLADGSWMTAHGMKQLTSIDHADPFTNTNITHNSTPTHGAALSYFDPVAELFNLLTGAPLLRGLLRLLTPKSLPHDISPLELNGTTQSDTQFSHFLRQPSLLSDVSSLNSMTKYPVVNNSLIDILEGQVVCLSVIAAFILVFLIREWVINQQPILNMPNPDRVDAQPVPAAPNNEARRVVRQRRRGLQRRPDREGQHDGQRVDMPQRPTAIPRPRRAATDENLTLNQTPEQAFERIQLPPRSSSLIPDSTSGHDVFEMDMDDNTLWHPQSHPGPPMLQRGMFDEVVDIRRNIEERIVLPPDAAQPGVDFYNIPELRTLRDNPAPSSAAQHDEQEGDDHVQRTDFVFGQVTQDDQPNHTAAGQFTFSSPIDAGDADLPSNDSIALRTDETASSNTDSPWDSLDELQHAQATVPIVDPLQTVPIVEATADQENAEGLNGEITGAIEVEPQPTDDDNTPDTVYDRVVNWMWHTDEQTPPRLPELAQTEQAIVANPHGGHALPVGNANAVNAQAPAAPAHEPNIQFGIDLNDPNALDDAEDLEGILELIGMEGPIAGMIQNIIFSVFLITLTLSASVWCPYIWGKIAILVLSNPIGVFVKAPLFFVSRCGNIIIDTVLFIGGLVGFSLLNITKLIKVVITPILPSIAGYIKVAAIESWSYGISQKSGARLEKALSGTFFGLRPDLPTFSMQSHHALRVFRQAGIDVSTAIFGDVVGTIKSAISYWQTRGVLGLPMFVINEIISFPGHTFSAIQSTIKWWHLMTNDLRMPPLTEAVEDDMSLVEWTTEDKILAVVVGYIFFALAGFAYLKIAHLVLGLNKDEKVDGMFADSLRQAGGVLKVIVIIGIEMIAFPLYCGSLLDCALLPLFEGATFQSRLDFLMDAPITCLFIHWFVGTCYMFHFALFVSMCRKIMRKGVLYFIRDPDDPTFHPVRDVLERPVTTQLGKIAFSACVYGGLVIVCLGGVVWSISSIGGILPVHWSTSEPRLAFPVDIIFYNFMLPFIVKRAELSKRISTMYEWWFRRCARVLRLSHFLFNEEREDEKYEIQHRFWQMTSGQKIAISTFLKEKRQYDGRYVRAPAADSVRIPKGTRVFVEVNEKNERIDGKADRDDGLHGKKDERFVKIWVPPNFRARIVVFVFLVWLFAASTGIIFTTLPLVVGRQLIRWAAASSSAPNDLYAFTVGLHVCGVIGFTGYLCISRKEQFQTRATEIVTNTKESLPHLYRLVRYTLGLVYLFMAVFIVLPFALSLLTELYIHMPIYSYFASDTPKNAILQQPTTSTPSSSIRPTIFILQTWTLGLLYLRVALRLALSYPAGPNRPSTAIRAIVRNGYLQPDISLASRALIFPALTLCIVLLAAPIGLAKVIIVVTGTTDPQERLHLYRSSFPVIFGLAVSVYVAMGIQHKIEGWRVKVRDEVYLVGERLHNFTEPAGSKKKAVPKVDKGKGKAVERQGVVTSNVDASTDTGSDLQEAQVIGHQFQDSEDVVVSGSSVR